ncbi:hypothetical protein K8I85_03270, partial [bacterium]|nr:hypothetical protein [bacterium]
MIEARLSGLRGHEDARALLTRSVAQDRVPHAMLFTGPEGVGKRTAAVALARELVCREDAEDADRFDRGAHDRFVLYQDLARPLAVPRRAMIPVAGSPEALRADYALLQAEQWITGVSARDGDDVVDLLLRHPDRFTGRKGIPFAAVLEKELAALAASKKATATVVDVARRLFSPGTSRAFYRRNLGIELINGKGDGAYFRTVHALLSRAAGDGWRVAVLD